MAPAPPDPRRTRLTGRLGGVLQAGSLALVVGLLVLFVVSLPLRWRQLVTVISAADPPGILGSHAVEAYNLSRLGQSEVEALTSLGLSLRSYAVYLLALELGLALICVG